MSLNVRDARERMVDGFLEAMVWVETSEDHHGKSLEDAGYSVWDVSDEARAAITDDCQTFIDMLIDAIPAEVSDDLPWHSIGADFYFTRNQHGVGFWDRSALYDKAFMDAATATAEKFNEVYAYVQDDKVEVENTGLLRSARRA